MNNNSQQLRKLTAQKVTIGGRSQDGNSDLFVYGDVDMRKNLIVRDNLTVLGKVTTEDTVNESLRVSNNVTIDGDLSVAGKTTLEKLILTTQVLNTVTVKEKLSVGSSATIASSLNEENFIEFTKTKHENDNDHELVEKGTSLGKISFKGSDGSKWIEACRIYSEVEGTPVENNISANMKLSTIENNTVKDRLIIKPYGNIGINENNPLSSVHINSVDSIIIPSGSVAERPNLQKKGQLRFNTELDKFEGYGPRNSWVKIGGGVIDIDEDTLITAENSDGTDSDELKFITDGNERMIIGSNGNIGIGLSNPTEKLEIQGNIKCHEKIIADSIVGKLEDSTYENLENASNLKNVGNLESGSITSSFGNIDIGDKLLKAGTLEINNNIGIGKFPAKESLDVYGNIRLSQKMLYSKTNQDKILLMGDENKTKISTYGGNETLRFYSGSIKKAGDYKTGNYSWYTADGKNWSQRMILTSEGKLGIGTDFPDEVLHVNGGIKTNGIVLGGTSIKVTADKINLLKNLKSDVQEQIDKVVMLQKIYSEQLETKLKEKDQVIEELRNRNADLEKKITNIENKLNM